MDDDAMQEAQNKKIKEDSFIKRQRLKEYNSKNYLICTLRFSIIEKVLTKYLFQNSGTLKDYSLNQLSQELKKDPENKSLFLSFCQILKNLVQKVPYIFIANYQKNL